MTSDEELGSLDKEIIRLQKSTRTTVPALLPLHDVLRHRFRWYYNWSTFGLSRVFHVVFLLAFLFAIGGLFYRVLFYQPGAAMAASASLVPTGAGGYSQWTATGSIGCGTANWCVASTNDGATSYVSAAAGTFMDTYGLTDLGAEVNGATFSSVTFSFVAWRGATAGVQVRNYYYNGSAGAADASYQTITDASAPGSTYSVQQNTNPITSAAWTWSTINSIQAGPQSEASNADDAFVTQEYATVNYTVVIPTVTTTNPPSVINTTSMTFDGNITNTGGAYSTTRGFKYSAGAACTDATTVSDAGSFGTGAFSKASGAMTVNTQYSERAFSTNTAGSGYGSCVTKYTLANAPAAPTVNTPTGTSLNVVINENGNPAITTYTFGIDQDLNGAVDTNGWVQTDGTLGASESTHQTKATWGSSGKVVTGLSTNTTYNFIVKAYNGDSTGTAFSAAGSGTTGTDISGTATIASSCSGTVNVAVAGVKASQTGSITGTAPNCTWSIYGVTVSSSQVVTVWIDNVADASESTAVTKYDGSGNITGMVLNPNVLSIGSGDNATLNGGVDVGSYTCATDEDVMMSTSGNDITVNGTSCIGGASNNYTDSTLEVLASNALTTVAGTTVNAHNFTIDGSGSFTAAGSQSQNISGNWTNNGTYTKASSTVTFNSTTEAQAIGGSATTDFANVTLSNTGQILTFNTNFSLTGTLTVSTTLAPGAEGKQVNSGGAAGTITGTGTVRVTRTTATADYANQYKFTTNTLTNSTVEYYGAGAQSVTSTVTYGSLKINMQGAYTATAAGNLTIGGDLTVSAGTLALSTYTANRSSAGGTLTLGASTTLNIGGTNTLPSNYSTHSINASSTVNYSGTTQSVSTLNSSQNYGNLTISGSLTKTLAGIVGVAGDLNVSAGTLDLSTYTANRTAAGGTLTLGASTTLNIGGTGTLPSNYSTHSISASSTVNYAGTTQSVATLNSSQNYGNLTISGSAIKTLAGTVGVAGDLNVSAGTLALSTYTANRTAAGGTLTLAASTTLNIGGTGALPSNYSTHSINSSSTVNYSGTNQNVSTLNSSQNYGNLYISGSGTKTLQGIVGVAGDLNISGGTFDLQSYTANRTAAGGTLTVANGAGLKIGGTGTLPSNYSTHSIGATSTIEYAGTTTVAALNSSQNYGNLIISGTGVTTAASFTVATTLNVNAANASLIASGGTVTMNASTSIANSGTLTFSALTIAGASVATSSSFTIGGAFTINGSSGITASSGTITMNNGSSISNSGTLNFSGLTIANGATVTTSSSFTVGGALTIGNASSNFSPSSGTITMNNSSSIANASNGTLSFSGLTILSGATVTTSASFTIKGALTIGNASSNFSPSGGTITMNNGASIANASNGTLSFSSLTIPDGATVTTGDNFTVKATFTVGSTGTGGATFTPTGGTVTFTGGSIVNNNSTLAFKGLTVTTGAVTTASNFTINNTFTISSGSFTASAGIITMSSTSWAISGSPTFSSLTIAETPTSQSNFSATLNGTLTVNANKNLSPSGGTITMGNVNWAIVLNTGSTLVFSGLTIAATPTNQPSVSFSVSGALTVNNGITLQPQASSTITMTGGSIVNNGTAASNLTFYNLTSSGAVSNSTSFNVANDFKITSSTFTSSGTPTYTVSGNVDFTGGSFTRASSTIVMNGAIKNFIGNNQSIYNLTIDGTITAATSNANLYGTLLVNAGKTLSINDGIRVIMQAGSTTTINNTGTIQKSAGGTTGRFDFYDSAGANLSITGTLSANDAFYAATMDVVVPNRTYGGSVYFVNTTLGNYNVTLGTNANAINIGGFLNVQTTSSGTLTVLGTTNNPAVNIGGILNFTKSSTGVPSISMGSNTWTVSGDVDLTKGAITAGTGANATLVMNGISTTLTPNGATFNNITFANTIGAFLCANDFAVNGVLNVDSSNFSPSAGTVTMNNGSSIANSGTLLFSNLTTAGSATVTGSNSFGVGGTFTVGSNSTFSPVAAAVVSGGTGTLIGSGTVKVTRTSATPDFASQYTINNKQLPDITVEYAGAADQTVTAMAYGYLKINMAGHIATQAGDVSTSKDLTIAAGTLASGDHNTYVTGNWSNSDTFTAGSGEVRLINDSAQSVTGNTSFNNFFIQQATGAKTVTFASDSTTTVGGTWTVQGGSGKVINLQASGANNWTVNPSLDGGGLANADVSYVNVAKSTNGGSPFCAKYSTDGNNNNGWYFSDADTCSPTPASGVTISNISETGFKVDWTDSPNEDNFKVYVAERASGDCSGATYGGPYATVNQNVTTKDVSGQNKNIRYCVGVAANSNIFGESSKNNSSPSYTDIEPVAGVTWGTFTTTDLAATPSNTPTNLSAGNSGIKYTVRKVSDDSLVEESSWQQNTNSFDPTASLAVNTQYKFEIQSRNGDGVTTTAASANKYTRANPPVTVSHSDINTDSVTWTWGKNSNPSITEFTLTDDSGGSCNWTADMSSCVAIGTKNANTQYTGTVTARNGDQVATTTAQASAYTAIQTPTTITAGLITPNSIELNITDSLTNLNVGSSGIQYEETSGNQNGGGEAAFTGWPQSASTTDTGLKGAVSGNVGTTYKYKIKARNAEGAETAQTAEFEFTTTAGTQLLFKLPGETLDENGGTHLLSYSDPTPDTVVAGAPFSLTIYAADGSDYRDLAHADTIALSSTDLQATFPAAGAMANGAITYNNVILKTVGNQTISGSGSAGSSHEVLVGPGICSASVSTASADPTNLETGHTSTVTIVLSDAFGNKLAGHAVGVGSNQPGDNITFSAPQTDANGRIFAYVTSATAHTSIITVSDTTDAVVLDTQPQIVFNAPPPPPTPTPTPELSPSATPTPTPTPTPTVSPGDKEPPTVPTNLRATDIGTTTIDLAWNASTDNVGVAGYELYNADTNILIATTTGTSASLSGLQSDTTYRFSIRAYDAAGNYSANSDVLSVKTKKPTGPVEEEVVAFLVMGNLPDSIDAGQTFPKNVRVSAADAGGKIVTGYNKAIYFSSSDKNARLAVDNKHMYTFAGVDAGIHEFAGKNFVLNTGGKQKLTVSDYSTSTTAEIDVLAPPAVPSVVRDFFTNSQNISKVNTGVVTTTTAVLLTPVLINTVFSLGTLLPQLFYWFMQFLQLLGIRKRRKAWGVVFNSQSGQPIPLAMVRIFDKRYNRVLEQAVTDNQGRFGFLVKEGTFYIQASKSGFTFPPKEKSSTFYEKIYVGGDFNVADKEQTVAYNIPMDPHTRPGFVITLWIWIVRINHFLQKLRLPLLVVGLIFALVMIFTSYSLLYLLSLIFYLLLGILEYLRTFKARPFGVVVDTYNHPLGMVIVRIYRKENNRLLETDVTDSAGRFRFLVAPGVYYLVAAKPGYIDFKSHLMYLQKEKTLVSTTIKLRKEEQ